MNRIVHVASGREWRGGQHQVLLLARGLHRRGIATTVVTGAGTVLARRLEDAQVPVEAVRWTGGLDPRVTVRVVRLLSSPAIVHVHDSHAHLLADLATRLRRAPIVVSRRVEFSIGSPRRLQRADAVIAISASVSRQVLAAGVSPDRVHLVPDAVDADVAPMDATTDEIATASRAPPLVVCVAALTREKGIDTLLEAAALVHASNPTVRWRVIGEGSERKALEARRERLGLGAVVDLPGGGSSATGAFRGATLAVQPSRQEGLGSAVLQALAIGVPVIASNAGGLADALAHGGGVLVPVDSPVELAGAVEHLLGNAAERARLAAEGRAAAGYFSVDRLVERTVDVYRSVTHSPGN
ncbi:MAG: glycosyltransferase [Gemmatimonadales bacterium]